MSHRADSQPRRRRGKILYLLLLAMVVTGFVPMSFLSHEINRFSEEELASALREKQLAYASAIGVALDERVDEARVRLGDLANSVGILASGRTEGELRRVLSRERFLDRFIDDGLVLLRLETRDGKSLRAGAEIPVDLVERLLAGGEAHGEEIISRPTYLPAAGVSIVVISRPIVAGRKFAGLLSAVYNLDPTWNGIVRQFNLPYTAFVLDQEGSIVAHSDPGRDRARRAPRNELVATFLSPAGRDTKETTRFVQRQEDGGEVQMLGTRVPTAYRWGVFVHVDESAAFSSVSAMRTRSRTLALGTLALGIAVAGLFAGTITRPIRHLAQASRAFARGEFGTRVGIRARNEIGELADTFNSMSSELESFIDKLKAAAEENHELFMGTTRALATAIDEKDPYTRGHSERVLRFSLILGRNMGLPERDLERLHIAALLHDVGKIGIDDRILRKPAALTDEEFALMKQHPVRGANILSGVAALAGVIPGMKHHHERYGGGGYPDGLAGDDIPLQARIICVADALDAMTTNRPYQRAMQMQAAVERVNDLQGKVFDPEVVAALNTAWESGELEAQKLAPGAPTVRSIRQGSGL